MGEGGDGVGWGVGVGKGVEVEAERTAVQRRVWWDVRGGQDGRGGA